MTGAIAWLADPWATTGPDAAVLPPGRWGGPDQLALPLSDRGLLLADGLFETVLVEGGQPRLLTEHLRRWRESAALLAMAPPPTESLLTPLITEAVARSGISAGALRLNWSRGSGGPGSRGLDLPAADQAQPPHRFWLQLTACQPQFSPVAVIVSRWEVRAAGSLLSRCKTFAYGGSIQARREARLAGADDALLRSSDGGLCCGTAATLLVQVKGRWLTPPLASGCLPGVMRQRALSSGLVEEAPLRTQELSAPPALALLLNSLGCRPIRACEGLALQSLAPLQAERFWRMLL